MRSPLVLAEGWDIAFYESEEALSRHVEEWFPTVVKYRAFDSEGRKLELRTEAKPVRRRWLPNTTQERVVARALESEPTHAHELREMLVEWLPMVGASRPPPDAPLQDVLAAAIARGDLHR